MLETLALGKELVSAGVENGVLEARWMSEACGGDAVRLREWVSRRISGEPLQYILGNVEFYGLTLNVGPGVLIPRPETEQLVELILERDLQGRESVCDLCTGSGAIALALGKERPNIKVVAVDLSSDALQYAHKNLRDTGVSNVRLLEGDLYAPLSPEEKFDVVVSNPPYVSDFEYVNLDREVKDWEPRMALEAGEDGLALLRRIAIESKNRLIDGGRVYCEIGEHQGAAVQQLFEDAGYISDILQDYAGRDRFLLAKYVVKEDLK